MCFTLISAKSSANVSSPLKKKTPQATAATVSAETAQEILTLKAANEQTSKAFAELRLEMDGLEKERGTCMLIIENN